MLEERQGNKASAGRQAVAGGGGGGTVRWGQGPARTSGAGESGSGAMMIMLGARLAAPRQGGPGAGLSSCRAAAAGLGGRAVDSK